MIAIYRESTTKTKSTRNHTFIKQDYSNRTERGENFAKDNILITFNDGKIQDKILFNRTETSANTDVPAKNDLNFESFKRVQKDELIDIFKSVEDQQYQHIKYFYESVKKKKKLENPTQKIQTVLKTTKDQMQKEFIIAFGGDLDHKKLDSKEFYNQSIKAAKNQLKLMGLSDKNLTAVVLHRDEKVQHFHVFFNMFDYENCQSLNSTHKKQAEAKKQSIREFRKDLLSNLQLEINKSYNFDFKPRKKQNIKHKTKNQWLKEETERLETELKEKRQEKEQKYLINFESLVKTNKFEDCKKTIEMLEKSGVSTGNSKSIFDEFLEFLILFLGRRKDKFINENIAFNDLVKTNREMKKETISF